MDTNILSSDIEQQRPCHNSCTSQEVEENRKQDSFSWSPCSLMGRCYSQTSVRAWVIKHPPVPSGGRHCFCFGGTARIRRLFCVFFSVVFSSIHQSQRVPGKPSATVCICVTASDEVLSSSVTRPVSLFAFCQHRLWKFNIGRGHRDARL